MNELQSEVFCGACSPTMLTTLPALPVRSALDINRTNFDTEYHWSHARSLRTRQYVEQNDREDIRNKARYEFLNNEFVYGIVTKFALYAVGTGPRLNFSIDHLIPNDIDENRNLQAKELCDLVATGFKHWTDSFCYFLHQWTAAINVAVDGEHLGVIVPNPRNEYCPYEYRTIDVARLANPDHRENTRNMKDGIFYDGFGNPEAYCILDVPDRDSESYDSTKYTIVPASQVIHIFMPVVAEQLRGYSVLSPSLQRIGRYRDYDEATLEGAKQAAHILGVIETQTGYVDNSPLTAQQMARNPYDQREVLGFDRGAWMKLPPLTTARVFDPKPSNTNYKEYMDINAQAMGMPLHTPKNRATGSSADYNYSSAKLDEQIADTFIDFYRTLADLRMNDKTLRVYYTYKLHEYFAKFDWEVVPEYKDAKKIWRYPVPKSIDPLKQEQAWNVGLKNGTLSKKEVVESRSRDVMWSDVNDQIISEGGPTGFKEQIEVIE